MAKQQFVWADIAKKIWLTRADQQEFQDTWFYSKPAQALIDKYKAGWRVALVWNKTVTATPEKDIYTSRDEYLSSYVWALWETYDKGTAIELEKFKTAQEDMDLQMKYYKEDFDKITSRKTQDYYKWMALQNKEFSKSLDYVSNLASRTIWSLEWFGKSRIVEATGDKMETDARYKLDFDRWMQDMSTVSTREEARYKLSTTRLAKGQQQYEDQRKIGKSVMWIEATWKVWEYYDTLITGQTLSEDIAAANRKDIIGWGTGVENIFNY